MDLYIKNSIIEYLYGKLTELNKITKFSLEILKNLQKCKKTYKFIVLKKFK